MTLYLYDFNNYYNRIIKRHENLEDYGTPLATFYNVNFVPNDGITTTQIINYHGDIPDYMIVVDTDGKMSRWYVIEDIRTRGGQYQLHLMRDVIADWYDEVVSAPCFIEKATLGVNNPLIFNNENMTYNQIKQSETPIKDESGVAWYAIYCNQDLEATIKLPSKEVKHDFETPNINTFTYYNYRENDYLLDADAGRTKIVAKLYNVLYFIPNQYYVGLNINNLDFDFPQSFGGKYLYEGIQRDPGAIDVKEGYRIGGNIDSNVFEASQSFQEIAKNELSSAELIAALPNYVTNTHSEDPTSLNGKIVLDTTTNTYYTMTVYEENSKWIHTTIPYASGLFNKLDPVMMKTEYIKERVGTDVWYYETFHRVFRFGFTKLRVNEANIVIPGTRRHSIDAPYDVLMIPDNGIVYRQQGTTTLYQSSQTFAMEFITALMGDDTASKLIYDIQRVPYTTLPSSWFKAYPGGSLIDIDSLEIGTDYATANEKSAIAGCIFFPQSVSAEKTITKRVVDLPKDAIELKVMNECDVYRIVSPNFNGQFEFSAAKNGGISGYTIATTLIPYTPYIKVAPIFGGLYGQSFNDARGMICSGDFSLTQFSSAWAEYKRNNQNYQEIFDRQIQNMEINNRHAAIQEGANAVTGTISGAATGAMMGMMTGNPYVAAAGGIAGGALAAGGGLADVTMGQQLRNEAIDYAKDNFGYQLGNIRAIPYNITKISTMSADNKIFPFLEYYTCSGAEKEALRNKIKYNGMSVGMISTIAGYKQAEPTYIKGKIIRMETLDDNFHVANTIAKEINNGVYI